MIVSTDCFYAKLIIDNKIMTDALAGPQLIVDE
jgi:hypothetical protein